MSTSPLDPSLIAVVLTALQAQSPARPTMRDAELAVGELFATLGPRLVEEMLQAAPDPAPPKKGAARCVRAAGPCATSDRPRAT